MKKEIIYWNTLLCICFACLISCKHKNKNKTIGLTLTNKSQLDTMLPKWNHTLTSYNEYLELKADSTLLDSIYKISLSNYHDYLYLRPTILRCHNLRFLTLDFFATSPLTSDSAILLANEIPSIIGLFCRLAYLPKCFKKNNLKIFIVNTDSMDCDVCDFSEFYHLHFLNLMSFTDKLHFSKKIIFPQTLVDLELGGENLNLKSFIASANVSNIEEFIISDKNLENIPIEIKNFTHLKVLNIIGTKLGKAIANNDSNGLDKLKQLKIILPKQCNVEYERQTMSVK